jgi:hypothetical protein
MSISSPPPPLTAVGDLGAQLASAGFAVLDAPALTQWCQAPVVSLDAWLPQWSDLPADQYLRDGGRYRRRRHGCFVLEGTEVAPAPHRAHWQPVEYNALHGGIERWFEPLPSALVMDPAWAQLLRGLARAATLVQAAERWFVEAHQFRIDTTDGIGRPTPEGAHRDGVDFVAVVLAARHNVKGGETRVFDMRGPQGVRFTLAEPWSALLLDDARVVHESTPIQPLDAARPAWRDTFVLTYRRHGFQGPQAILDE